MKNYYKLELKQLKDSEYFKSITVSDGQGARTKNLDLNNTSIPVLIKFLENELKRLKGL